MKRKYPVSLFVCGFLLNFFAKYLYLFLSALILMVVGIWVRPCLFIGLGVLGVDLILSFALQLRLRKTALNSTDPNFAEWQDALLSKDWKARTTEIVSDKINENDTVEDETET